MKLNKASATLNFGESSRNTPKNEISENQIISKIRKLDTKDKNWFTVNSEILYEKNLKIKCSLTSALLIVSKV